MTIRQGLADNAWITILRRGLQGLRCIQGEGAVNCSYRLALFEIPRSIFRFTGNLVACGLGVGLLAGAYKLWEIHDRLREFVESQHPIRQYVLLYLIKGVLRTEFGPDLDRKVNIATIAMLSSGGLLLYISLEYFVKLQV